ncbi:hypothetical protein niasHT_028019 [Heterodera trifolii]|uniref:CTLH domain-containing protein n=1 Tax=Heterodera trifolii TaxID=157864 RepID=A0ABD2KEI0_9BILA
MNESDEIYSHLPPLNCSVKEEDLESESTWFNAFMEEASEDIDSTKLHELVTEYLVFNGYKEAAKMLVEDAELPLLNTTTISNSRNVDTLEQRNAIRDAVIGGAIDSALLLVNEIAPTLLNDNSILHFKLLRQQLVELIRNKNIDQVLNFSQQKLVDKCKEIPAELFAKLEQTYALLAFENPDTSPFGYLMSFNQRNVLAAELNEAVLSALHKPCVSRLEQLFRLMVWNQHQLKTKSDGTKLKTETVEEMSKCLFSKEDDSFNDNFIPHSPLSYSTSYSPISPLKEQQQVKCADPSVADLGKTNVGFGPTNKSILKNPTTLFFKEQQKKFMKSNENLVDSVKKATETTAARKEALKTVAFGLTTRLEDTVLANKSVPSSSRLNKTVIFSHEAQSLHKIILAQQTEIAELRGKIEELTASDGRRRGEEREQKNTIAELASRLGMVERALTKISNTGQKCHEENRENGKPKAYKCIEADNLEEEETEEENIPKERRVAKTSVGKRMVLKQRQMNGSENNNNAYQNHEVEIMRSQKRNSVMPPIAEETSLVHRSEILQRLDHQMRKNPNFENRIKSMLRVWTDDMSSPAIGASILEHPREESGAGASMVVRVTTQHQEVFYSSSPARNRKAQPIPRRQKQTNHQPIVTEISDDSAEEQLETVPNVRRSDLCTDDAEFFRNNDEQLEDDFVGEFGRINTNNYQQPFRRRRREATSAIRNKYK